MSDSTDVDLFNDEGEEVTPTRRWRWDWIFPLFFRPRKTLSEVVSQDKAFWLLPLLLISLLVIFNVVASGPARLAEIQMNSGQTPPDFQYWSPDQQQKYFDSLQQAQGPVNLYVFPALGGIIGLWVVWFLTGSILHLVLTLSGSRGSNTAALNVVGWASLPFALRAVIQGAAVLVTKTPIHSAGLSGFVTGEGGAAAFWAAMLAVIDIYWIWHFILLLVAARPLSGLPRGRAWLAVLISIVILLALQALPGFIGSKLSGLGGTTPYYFFF